MFVIIFIDGSPFNRTFPMFPTRILPWPPALWHRRPWMPQLGFNMVPSWVCENGIAYGIICNIIDLYIYFFFGFWLFTLEFLFWGSTELADLFLPPFRQLIAKINPQPILLRQRGNPSTTVDGSQKWRIFHHRRLQVMSIGMFLLGWRDGATLTTKNWWFRKIYPLVN
jgi:hypothetical protein